MPAPAPRPAATWPALKEWSAAVHAMLDGRQTVLLRKGGIHEKRFRVAVTEFPLFPTVAHSQVARVRPEHRDLLKLSAVDSTDTSVVIRAAARIVAAIEVTRPEALSEIEDLHIWTADSVREDRLDFRPRHRLTALVVQPIALADPLLLDRGPWCGGCASWVDLPVPPGSGVAVRDLGDLAEVARRVTATVG